MSNNIFSNDSTNKTVEETSKIDENNTSNVETLADVDTIGGFDVDTRSIHTPGKTSLDSDVQGMYLGTDGSLSTGNGDNYFRVSSNYIHLNGLPLEITHGAFALNNILGSTESNIYSLVNFSDTITMNLCRDTDEGNETLTELYVDSNLMQMYAPNVNISSDYLSLYCDKVEISGNVELGGDFYVDNIGTPKKGIFELYVQEIRRGAAPIYVMPRGMTSTNKAAVFGTTDGAASSYVCFRPGTNNTGWLGMSSYKWNYIYSNHALQTSDRNLKENIKDLELDDRYMKMYDELKPVSFNLKDDDEPLTYTGLVAQDVEDAMEKAGLEPNDFAALRKEKDIEILSDDNENEICKPVMDENGEEKYNYSLDYTKFVALNIMKIKQLEQRIKDLERENEQRKVS